MDILISFAQPHPSEMNPVPIINQPQGARCATDALQCGAAPASRHGITLPSTFEARVFTTVAWRRRS
jgi:hypothetical protein